MALDPADWLLTAEERANPRTTLDDLHPDGTAWSTQNLVRPLIHGATYFAELAERIAAGCLVDSRAVRAFVRVEKLDHIPGAFGVEIARARMPEAAPRRPPPASASTSPLPPRAAASPGARRRPMRCRSATTASRRNSAKSHPIR